MNDPKHRHNLSTEAVLKLVRRLTIGQRLTDTEDRLSSFLHESIFPDLSPCITEIYYHHPPQGSYVCSQYCRNQQLELNTPPHIRQGSSVALKLRAQSQSLLLHAEDPLAAQFAATGNQTHLLIPLLDKKELSGIIYLGCRQRTVFSHDFFTTLEAVAAIIGSRMKSMTTIGRLKESMRALEKSEQIRKTLNDINQLAHNSNDLDTFYQQLHQLVGRLLHARNFYVAITDQAEQPSVIRFPYYHDEKDSQFHGMEISLENRQLSLTGYLLQTGTPLLITPDNLDELLTSKHISCVGARPHSWLGAPFFVNSLWGAVVTQSYAEVVYTDKDKELMAYVARHVGDALARKKALEDLKVAKDRAEVAERNKSNFLANMSHEIRTPMNGILGLTDLVLNSQISSQQRMYMEMIQASADRLLKLINDILDFSKIEAGKLELNPSVFNLREKVAESIQLLSLVATKKNVALQVQCEESIPKTIWGDGDKLGQVLINLVGNGLKFTEAGSVRLSISRKESPENSSPGDLWLYFEVRDTGIGIAPQEIQNVFKAFSQVSRNRNSNNPGTGLGLVIAAELVELMGGKICVESTKDSGTTFYFTARFGTVDQPRPGDPALDQLHSSKNCELPERLHVLLVEDEYINQTLAKAVLEREGWQVDIADNGKKALAMIASSNYDLVFMDIQMPELNGMETTLAIRRQERETGGHLPIVAMTAYAVVGDREKCLEAGMDGYISKPIHPKILRNEIEQVLCRQQAS